MRTLLCAVILVAGSAVTVWAQPGLNDDRQCARILCDEIRSCTTDVQEPFGSNPEIVDQGKRKDQGPVVTRASRKSDQTQGFSEGSCRLLAYWDFIGCGGQVVRTPVAVPLRNTEK